MRLWRNVTIVAMSQLFSLLPRKNRTAMLTGPLYALPNCGQQRGSHNMHNVRAPDCQVARTSSFVQLIGTARCKRYPGQHYAVNHAHYSEHDSVFAPLNGIVVSLELGSP